MEHSKGNSFKRQKSGYTSLRMGQQGKKTIVSNCFFTLLPVIVVLAALALSGFIIYILIKLGKSYKKYFWDNLSLFITFFSLAGIVFFADLIRIIISTNVILLFLFTQLIYIFIRSFKIFINK